MIVSSEKPGSPGTAAKLANCPGSHTLAPPSSAHAAAGSSTISAAIVVRIRLPDALRLGTAYLPRHGRR